MDQEAFIARTIELAAANVQEGGRPFACVVARGEEIVAESPNRVAQTHDPPAHAEYAKPYQERRLPMVFERRDEALDVYRRWARRNP